MAAERWRRSIGMKKADGDRFTVVSPAFELLFDA
jgi:hypothetical protein